MDIQYFCRPEEADQWYEYWKKNRQDFYTQAMGFSPEHVKWRQHDPDERAFYAKDAWDVQYQFGEIGFQESRRRASPRQLRSDPASEIFRNRPFVF